MAEESITCPDCHRTSYNPNDIKYKYCGNCHKFLQKVWWFDSPDQTQAIIAVLTDDGEFDFILHLDNDTKELREIDKDEAHFLINLHGKGPNSLEQL